MLKFKIDFTRRLDHSLWVRGEAGWRNGSSWVEPFRNPALEHAVVAAPDRTVIVARERIRGHESLPEFSQSPISADWAGAWPGDFVVLTIADNSVTIETGCWGAAPIYISSDDRSLLGSWNFGDHRHRISLSALDEREVVGFLSLRQGYSSRTISREVRRLTERCHAEWSPGRPVAVSYPTPAVHYQPRDLRDGAQVAGCYGQLLADAVGLRDVSASDVVLELSGGTDSATVAFAARNVFEMSELSSYGLLIGGRARAQQVRRRGVLAGLAGLSDVTVDALDHLPLAPAASDEVINPCEEPYRDAVTAALKRARRPVVFTGIGGDELLAPRPAGRQDRASYPPPSYLSATARDLARELAGYPDVAPATVIPETALLASMVRAPMFLRAGRWPVSPLCSPTLVTFGEWLPIRWRENKTLAREWLLGHGVPRDVAWPRLRENFTHVMRQGLRQHGLGLLHKMLTEGLMLADLGYVDADALVDLSAAAEAGAERGRPVDPSLHELVTLERGLRALLS